MPTGSRGSGRVFLDRRPPRPVPLAVATSLQAVGPSVWTAQPRSQGSTVGGRIASRLLPLKWLLSDFWAPLSPWRTAAIPQGGRDCNWKAWAMAVGTTSLPVPRGTGQGSSSGGRPRGARAEPVSHTYRPSAGSS